MLKLTKYVVLLFVSSVSVWAQSSLPPIKGAATSCVDNIAYVTGSLCYSTEQNAITAASGGLIHTPPGYAGSDAPNGSRIVNLPTPTISTQSNASHVFDFRYGGEVESQFNPGADHLSGILSPNQLIVNWTQINFGKQSAGGFNDVFAKTIQHNILFGSQNVNANGYTNKTAVQGLNVIQNSWSSLQAIAISTATNCYGNGDCVAAAFGAHSWGGSNAASDEGVKGITFDISQGYVETSGPASGSPASGATSLIFSPNQGQGIQADGRPVIDVTQGVSTGTITSLSGSGQVTVTGSSTVFGTSTVTTTGAAITVSGSNTTPGSVNVLVGSSTGFTANTSVACVADNTTFEYVLITAVPDSTHLTATFTLPHASGATIATGGRCGWGLSLTADVYTGSGPAGYVTVIPPLRQVWPFVSSSSNTSAVVWLSGGGAALTYTGGASFPGAAHTDYPMAFVTDIRNGGDTVSNTITVSPNTMSVANGDILSVTDYPYFKVNAITAQVNSFFGQNTIAGGIQYNGILTGPSQGWGINNNTPPALYSGHGGTFAPPKYSWHTSGLWNYGMWFDWHPDQILFFSDCGLNSSATLDCSVNIDRKELGFNAGTGSGDFLTHNTFNNCWKINSNTTTFSWCPTAFTIPLATKLTVTHGSNATAGVSALSGGTVTVSTTAIAALAGAGGAGDTVSLSLENCSSCGILSVGTVSAGTSFVINSSNVSDASNVFWQIGHLN